MGRKSPKVILVGLSRERCTYILLFPRCARKERTLLDIKRGIIEFGCMERKITQEGLNKTEFIPLKYKISSEVE